MVVPSGIIVGFILVVAGLFLVVLSFALPMYFLLIYSVILLAMGLYMLFNSDKEDQIEQIRNK